VIHRNSSPASCAALVRALRNQAKNGGRHRKKPDIRP
jgi:hypothetical protein